MSRHTFLILFSIAVGVVEVNGAQDYEVRYACYTNPKGMALFLRDFKGDITHVEVTNSTGCQARAQKTQDKKSKLYEVVITEENFTKCNVKGVGDSNRTVTVEAWKGFNSVVTAVVEYTFSCDFTKGFSQRVLISAEVRSCYNRETTANGAVSYMQPEFYCEVRATCVPRKYRCNGSPHVDGCYDIFGREHGCDAYSSELYNVRKVSDAEPQHYMYRGFAYYVITKDDVATEEDILDPKHKNSFNLSAPIFTQSRCTYDDVGEYLTWYNVRRATSQIAGCFDFHQGFEEILKNYCVSMNAKPDPDAYFATASKTTCGSSALFVHYQTILIMLLIGAFNNFP